MSNSYDEDQQIKIWEKGYEGLHQFAILTIKSLILANGAAVISLLTFMGSVAKSGKRIPYDFSSSFSHYLHGVSAALLVCFIAYLFLIFEFELKKPMAAIVLRVSGVLVLLLSLVSFYLGSLAAVHAIAAP